ncbi:MAG: VTT domain-containing protein [Acidobacteriota bacterium]
MSTARELTYTGVLVAVFANQIGLPIPAPVVLIGAGALSAHGNMRAGIALLMAVLGCLAADGIWYWAGRRWGNKAIRFLYQLTSHPREAAIQAHEKFHKYGLGVLCVSKFLPGLDAAIPPLSGAEGTSPSQFLTVDAVGSLLWSGLYIWMGYAFSHELTAAIRWAQQFGIVVGMAVGIPIGLYAGWRGLALVRMIRELRVRRISAPMLAERLENDSKLAILDLANFEEGPDGDLVEGIPGAFRVDPRLLRKSGRVIVPDDVDIVLYCSSGSDTVSARAAVGLKRIGIRNVWVLEGGLKAWREHGFPLSCILDMPEAVAARVGAQLPG